MVIIFHTMLFLLKSMIKIQVKDQSRYNGTRSWTNPTLPFASYVLLANGNVSELHFLGEKETLAYTFLEELVG